MSHKKGDGVLRRRCSRLLGRYLGEEHVPRRNLERLEGHSTACRACAEYLAELAALRPERLKAQNLFVAALAANPPRFVEAASALRVIRESRFVRQSEEDTDPGSSETA